MELSSNLAIAINRDGHIISIAVDKSESKDSVLHRLQNLIGGFGIDEVLLISSSVDGPVVTEHWGGMRRYRLYNIAWDTSNENHPEGDDPVILELPNEVIVDIENDDIFDPTEDAADFLSNNYGFCIFSCSWEEIK